MSKPWIHASSDAKLWGIKPEDTLPIHDLMDSSKAAVGSNLHRALTHNAWFIGTILEKIFGTYITAQNGRIIQVRDIGERHVLQDFGNKFIPTAEDWITTMQVQPWQLGRGCPPSFKALEGFHGTPEKKSFRIID